VHDVKVEVEAYLNMSGETEKMKKGKTADFRPRTQSGNF
jgi:hypothetical protein